MSHVTGPDQHDENNTEAMHDGGWFERWYHAGPVETCRASCPRNETRMCHRDAQHIGEHADERGSWERGVWDHSDHSWYFGASRIGNPFEGLVW